MSDTTTVPTLTTVDEAHTLLRQLAGAHDWVSVFWDRGWGDHGGTAVISVIVDGDGNDPKARVTAEVYRQLVDQRIVGENSYGGFKARRLHDFKTPPVPEKTGPDASEIAEQVVRDVMASKPRVPILAEFFRGLDPNSRTPRILHEYATTDAYDGGPHVEIRPAATDLVVGAYGKPGILGSRLVGEVAILPYPNGEEDPGAVDVAALTGEGFRAALTELVELKWAEARAAS